MIPRSSSSEDISTDAGPSPPFISEEFCRCLYGWYVVRLFSSGCFFFSERQCITNGATTADHNETANVHLTDQSRTRMHTRTQRRSFCSCWSRAMEQFTATSQRCWLTVQSVPAVT